MNVARQRRTVELPLKNSDKKVLIDWEDEQFLSLFDWHLHRRGYVVASVKLHRIMLGHLPKHKLIDHIDGDPLNNTRDNLRVVNASQNAWNRKTRFDSRSGYKGVLWHKKAGKWGVRITVAGKIRQRYGLFKSPEAAARKYNELARRYFGEYARLNVIPGDE